MKQLTIRLKKITNYLFGRGDWLNFVGAVALIASACATPIGVTRVDPRTAQYELTANALNTDKPSSFSSRQLLNLDLYELFNEDPKAALAKLHQGLAPTGDEDRVFALAELSFLYAENGGGRSYYLAATAYASAFLLPGKNGTPPRPIDPRARWAVDIYNRALARGLTSDDGQYVVLKGGQFALPFGELTVTFNEQDLIWTGFRLKDFVSAAELQVRGLRNRYREPGVGAPLVAAIEPIESLASAQYKRIPPRMKIPVSAFLRYDDARGELVSGKLTGQLELYNPDSTRTVKINGVDVPIEYEITPALADTLEGAPVWDFEIAGFRSGDFSFTKSGGDGLFMVGPHRYGHIPVVLVHGTASSPARWAEMVNEVGNDPRLFDRYELWFFMYNTGNPIAYSAMLLRDALTKTVEEIDPEGKDPGLKQMIVMGHSQGGLLTKMTVVDSGMDLWPFSVPPEELNVSAETRELLTHALIIKPLPFVKRVIFVATPHRGSYQALGFLGALGSWFVNLPGRLTKMTVDVLTLQKQGVLLGGTTAIPTSIDNMNPNNFFIKHLASLPLADGVVAHSIIAVDADGPLEDAGDGVVKYMSAHIDGVESEKIVRSSHSVQGNPETILEVKRILHEHAKGLPPLAEKSSPNLNK
jgi:triacylglycerol esterase/lipase EstA (alpha/beta hydrolase family)